ELRGAALGNVAMPITGAGLIGAGNEAGVAGGVFGTGKSLHVTKGRNGGERDHRADAGDGLEAPDIVPHPSGQLAKDVVDRADLLASLPPHGVVEADALLHVRLAAERIQEPIPAGSTPQRHARAAWPAGPTQEPFGSIDLGRLDADE